MIGRVGIGRVGIGRVVMESLVIGDRVIGDRVIGDRVIGDRGSAVVLTGYDAAFAALDLVAPPVVPAPIEVVDVPLTR